MTVGEQNRDRFEKGDNAMNAVTADSHKLARVEDALRRSEKLFGAFFDSTPVMIHSLNDRWELVSVNDHWLRVLGYERHEVLGRKVTDFMTETSRQEAREVNFPQFQQTGISRDVEVQFVRKNGEVLDTLLSAIAERDEQGRIDYTLSFLLDITDRKRAEMALQSSEARFAAIFRSAMDAIVIVDSEFRISMFNDAAERVFSLPSDEALGRSFRDFLCQDSRAVLDQCIRSVQRAESRYCYLWAPEGLTALRADGEEVPVEATVSLVELGEQRLYAIILRDINDRMRAEAELQRLQEEKIYLQQELETTHSYGEIVGTTTAIKGVYDAIEKVAATDSTVLITGETGTGKELVARAIHAASERRDKVLVKVDCAALPAGLIESELFGHERGAFTGATSRKIGRFELANGGSIFLDEIGDLPLDLQTKLLRVLQEGEFERVGDSQTRRVDVRVIAATNRHLSEAIDEGKFRSDLFYRLNVFPIHVPALRDRREDIPLLVKHLTMKYCVKLGKNIESIPQGTMNALVAYDWPGNVRELENVIERGVILTGGSELELGDWLPRSAAAGASRIPTLEELERNHITQVLEVTGWRVRGDGGAAALLGLKPTTLEARMKKLGVERRR